MSSTKKKPAAEIVWGPWEEIDANQYEGYSYYRSGTDRDGVTYDDWDDGSRVPRHANVDQITQGLGSTALNDPAYFGTSYTGDVGGYTHDQPPKSYQGKGKGVQMPDKYDDKPVDKSRSSKKDSRHSKPSQHQKPSSRSKHPPDKGHSDRKSKPAAPRHHDDDEPEFGEPPEGEPDDPFYNKQPVAKLDEGQADQLDQPGQGQSFADYSGASGQEGDEIPQTGFGYGYDTSSRAAHFDDAQQDRGGYDTRQDRGGYDTRQDDVERPSASSRQDWPAGRSRYGDRHDPSLGQAQDAAGLQEEEGDAQIDALHRQQDAYWQSHSSGGPSREGAYAEPEPDLDPDDRSNTPKGTRPHSLTIHGTAGDSEPLDPRYVVEQSWKFQPGEVFKVLWAEPDGGGLGAAHEETVIRSFTEHTVRENEFGRFHVGFRRFIIVATDDGHSTCVPILTHGRKGLIKKGSKQATKHGIIHTNDKPATRLTGEPKLGFPPVQMRVKVPGEKLARESRVNYSKLVTVEHNVKVFFVGSIVSKDVAKVGKAVDECWLRKRKGH